MRSAPAPTAGFAGSLRALGDRSIAVLRQEGDKAGSWFLVGLFTNRQLTNQSLPLTPRQP
jgi:hypothetical protein